MKRIYAIWDNKGQTVLGSILNLHSNDAAACRWFSDVARSPDTMVYRHPQDFDLVCLGFMKPAYVGNDGTFHEAYWYIEAIEFNTSKVLLSAKQVRDMDLRAQKPEGFTPELPVLYTPEGSDDQAVTS